MSHLRKVLSLVSVVGLGLAVSAASCAASGEAEAIKERIQPVGELCMAGDACAAAMVVAAADTERTVESIYKSKCFSCHATGVAGAPKFGEPGDWKPRLDKGMDTLYTSALNGLNAMPPKGLCMDCSEEEIKETVDYMVENSK